MTTIKSTNGEVESVTVRRTESVDAQEINNLISSATSDIFGNINVIHLLWVI